MHNPIQESPQNVTGLTDFDAIGLFDHLPGMVYRCRWDGDWTMEFVSQGSQALTGYRPEDLTANPMASWSRLIHTDDLGRVSKDVRSALKQGEAFGITYRLSLPDGTEKWVTDNGRRVSPLEEYPPRIEGFVSDVTEQRRHEAAAREWREVVEEVPVALVTIDAEGRIKEWNRQAETVFGWKREVVLGESFVETIIPADPPEKRREGMRRLGELQVSQVLSQNLGLTARDKTGREFPIELTISAKRNGESAHFNAFIHDISQRKGSEKSLEEAKKTISRLMRKDPLTGLANRKFLEEDMVRTLSFARRWRQPFRTISGPAMFVHKQAFPGEGEVQEEHKGHLDRGGKEVPGRFNTICIVYWLADAVGSDLHPDRMPSRVTAERPERVFQVPRMIVKNRFPRWVRTQGFPQG